jgi:hypothetical protein
MVVLLIFAGCAAVAIAFSPIGGAVAARIRRGGMPDPELPAEVNDLRARLAEVEDRLDFAERQLTGAAGRRLEPLKPEA